MKERCHTSKLGKLMLKKLIDIDKNQKWLAEQVGITKGYICCIVSGKHTPSLKH